MDPQQLTVIQIYNKEVFFHVKSLQRNPGAKINEILGSQNFAELRKNADGSDLQ